MYYQAIPIKGGFSNVAGFFCDGLSSGIKKDKKDIGFIYSDTPCDVSSLFTTSKFKASPIVHYLAYPKDFQTNFVLLNSKNANAMNGKEGLNDVVDILSHTSKKIDLLNPIMSSTGVIGKRLELDKMKQAIDKFDISSKNDTACSECILTTDTVTKTSTYEVQTNKGVFTISAIAKGAGMIDPSMATLLCFIVTDADIPKEDMDELLKISTHTTFNAISVDGDTSTNDTVMLLANKKSGAYDRKAFLFTLTKILQELSINIIEDGEGTSKVVAFNIRGAKNDKEAQIIAKKLSNSLLVKTAIFGQDPNWGRIGATIGASGCECDESLLSIFYDEVCVYEKGKNIFSPEVEQKAFEVLKKDTFSIICDIGIADGKFIAFGCDLGYDYIKINAEYRT